MPPSGKSRIHHPHQHIKPSTIPPSSYAVTDGNIIILIVTARVAKRAKVMFSQVCVTHSVQRWGGGEVLQHQRPLDNTSLPPTQDQVTTPPTLPPPNMVTTPPSPPHPPGPGHNTPLPPGTRSQHLPPSLPLDMVTTPPCPRTSSQHPPSDQVDNTPPPRTRSQHPPTPQRDQVDNTPPPGPGGQHPLPPDMVTAPPTPGAYTVRILLECILVGSIFQFYTILLDKFSRIAFVVEISWRDVMVLLSNSFMVVFLSHLQCHTCLTGNI